MKIKKRGLIILVLSSLISILILWIFLSEPGHLLRLAFSYGRIGSEEFEYGILGRNDTSTANAILYLLKANIDETEQTEGGRIRVADEGNLERRIIAMTLLRRMGASGFDACSTLLYSDNPEERNLGIYLCWSSPLREHVITRVREIAQNDESIDCRFEALLRLVESSPAAELALCELLLINEDSDCPKYAKIVVDSRVVTRNTVDVILALCNKYHSKSDKWREFFSEEVLCYLKQCTSLVVDHDTPRDYLDALHEVKSYTYYCSNLAYDRWLADLYQWPVGAEDDISPCLDESAKIAGRDFMGFGPCRKLVISETRANSINPYTSKPIANESIENVFRYLDNEYKKLRIRHLGK